MKKSQFPSNVTPSQRVQKFWYHFSKQYSYSIKSARSSNKKKEKKYKDLSKIENECRLHFFNFIHEEVNLYTPWINKQLDKLISKIHGSKGSVIGLEVTRNKKT